MAAKKFVNVLVLVDTLELAHGSLQAIEGKPSDGPISLRTFGSNWPIKLITKCCMRLPYGPTFLEVGRIAAEMLLALVHTTKPLLLADSFELVNFIKDIWFELAHQAHNGELYETATWAHIF